MTTIDFECPHIPVLYEELTALYANESEGVIIDATAGFGGHIEHILTLTPPEVQVVAIDRDQDAIDFLNQRFVEQERVRIVHEKFSNLNDVVAHLNITGKIIGIYADIGVSSWQLNEQQRGFSLQTSGPLDMRMDIRQDLTAADIVNQWSLDQITTILRNYGDEPRARFLAKSIVNRREQQIFSNTLELADFVKTLKLYRTPSKKHPATRLFQAIRIAVNDEIGQLQSFLQQSLYHLNPAKRLAVISFHSIEDRIVKHQFKTWQQPKIPSEVNKLPLSEMELRKKFPSRGTIVKPFPIGPSKRELDENPRSRSAKLRCFEKSDA